jgi:uncharacterized protein (TIGR04141 family)
MPLTVYALRERVDGEFLRRPDQVVDPDRLAQHGVTHFEVPDRFGFSGRLYLELARPEPPSWIWFLRGAVEALPWQEQHNPGALLVIRSAASKRWFALPFGRTGRFLLRRDAYERGYGLRVALNILCEGDEQTPEDAVEEARLRYISARRFDVEVLHTQRQVNRLASFNAFGMDGQRDLVNGVVGEPALSHWGPRIQGADFVKVFRSCDFAEVGVLCDELHLMRQRLDYKDQFPWVDDVYVETDPNVVQLLEQALVQQLRNDAEGLHLTEPEFVDWSLIESYRFNIDSPEQRRTSLLLADYLDRLEELGLRSTLDIALLRRHEVQAVGVDGELVQRWSVFDCVDGELATGRGDDGRVHYIASGEFFTAAREFLVRLDKDLSRIGRSAVELPAAKPWQDEGDYNTSVAGRLGYLLLDKQLIPMRDAGRVEICDLLTLEGTLIHVKRFKGSFTSSVLSHLFAQGAVSADLLVKSPDFREQAVQRIQAIERAALRSGHGEQDRFSRRFTGAFRAADHEVVYAIIGPWEGRSLTALPFFSKVNLRRHHENLASMHFKVSYAPVESLRA